MNRLVVNCFSFNSIMLHVNMYKTFDRSYIHFTHTTSIQNADWIVMDLLNYFDLDDVWFGKRRLGGIYDNIDIRNFFVEKKDIIKNKKIILFIHGESFTNKPLYKVLNDMVNNLNISLDDIIILDSTILSYDGKRHFVSPIDLLVKGYSPSNDPWFKIPYIPTNNEYRTKKISSFNFKFSFIRLVSVFSMIDCYEDISEFFKDNEVTMFDESYDLYLKEDSRYALNYAKAKFKYDEIYKRIKLPIKFIQEECQIFNGSAKSMFIIHEKLRNSCFSIVLETTNNYIHSASILSKNNNLSDKSQLSEKTFNTFLNGTLPFIIESGEFYKKLSEYGFDFSYLKNEFDIDYENNTVEENFLKIKDFTNKLKNMSIEDVNQLRNEYNHTIVNNYNLIRGFLSGKITEKTYNLLKSLIPKKLL